jgi:O-antigen/teichoic acid export membrane protein
MTPDTPRKGRARDILLNTLTSYLRDGIEIVSFIALIPFIIRTLGTESFGLWSLVWSFVSLFSLIDMGIGSSVVKYVGEARGQGDLERQKKIVATIFWIYTALGAVLMLCVGASALFFNELFSIPEAQREAARMVLIILGARSALSIPLDLFRGILIGYQRYRVPNVYRTLGTIAYLILVLLFLPLAPTLWTLALLNMATGVIPRLLMVVYTRMHIPGVSLHIRHFDRSAVREVFSFSVYILIVQVAGLIYTRVDALIIQAYLSLEMVALYSIAMRLADTAERFCTQLNRVLTPVVAELQGAGEQENIRKVWFRGSKLSVAMATPLLLGLGFLAEPLIVTWTGPEFLPSVPALYFLVGATFIGVLQGNSENVLSMGGQQRFLAFALIGGQILNIALSVALIGPLGITGVGMATLLSAAPVGVCLIQIKAGRQLASSQWTFYRETVLPSLPSALLIAVFLYGVQRRWEIDTLWEVGLAESMAIALFGVSFWWIGFSPGERAYFLGKGLRMFRRKNKEE